ncbi:hypothetical protein BN1723_016973, partial [Verticillium longisporum]
RSRRRTMTVFAVIIINKAGGLIFHRTFHEGGLNQLSTNDYLVLAGTFHGEDMAGDKENQGIDNPKKKHRGGPAHISTIPEAAQILSPTSTNARYLPRERTMASPAKPAFSRPASPTKAPTTARSALTNMVERAKAARPAPTRKTTTSSTTSSASAAPAAASAPAPAASRTRRAAAKATAATGAKRTVMGTIRKGVAASTAKKAAATATAAAAASKATAASTAGSTRLPRFEALQAQRVCRREYHRNQLLGKYQLSVMPQSAKKRLSANVARGDDVLIDDPEKLKREKEQEAMSQTSMSNWHVAATRYLNGGCLISAPVAKRLARLSRMAPGPDGVARDRARILDLGGQATCDWAWHCALQYPNTKIYT